MKASTKIALAIIALAAVASAVVLTRPHTAGSLADDPELERMRRAQKRLQTLEQTAGPEPNPLSESVKELIAVSKEVAREGRHNPDEQPVGIAKQGKGSEMVPPSARHTKSAKRVRPNTDILSQKVVKRPRHTADWSRPQVLPMRRLNDLYLGLTMANNLGRDFDDQVVKELSGAAVIVTGAIMPLDEIPEDGRFERFWIAHPSLVMKGCVFCSPPTLGDLVYVEATEHPIRVDPEDLYNTVVISSVLGRLELGPNKTEDGIEYLYGLELEDIRREK